jgi:hypothetical protein
LLLTFPLRRRRPYRPGGASSEQPAYPLHAAPETMILPTVEHTFLVEHIGEVEYPGVSVYAPSPISKTLVAVDLKLSAGGINIQVKRNAEVLETVHLTAAGGLIRVKLATLLADGDQLAVNIVGHEGESPGAALRYSFAIQQTN